MNVHFRLISPPGWLMVGFALLLGSTVPADVWAQGHNSLSFSSVKVGQWVKVDGIPQKDGTVLANEVKLLTGDFQDDDWEVSGKISRVDRGRKALYILGLKVRTTNETEYESSDEKTKATFAMLRPGLLVEIEGTFLKDGTFLADEIADESANPKKRKKANQLSFVGKVQKVDENRQALQVMGIVFQVNNQTKFKSKVK